MLGIAAPPRKTSGSWSVKAIGLAAGQHRGEPRHEARMVIAGALHRLAEFDGVLGLEMAAGEVVGAGERHEGDLLLLPQRPQRILQRRMQAPVRSRARQRRRASSCPASAPRWSGATRNRSRSTPGSRRWRRRRRRAGTRPAVRMSALGAAQTRPATVSGRAAARPLRTSRRCMAPPQRMNSGDDRKSVFHSCGDVAWSSAARVAGLRRMLQHVVIERVCDLRERRALDRVRHRRP